MSRARGGALGTGLGRLPGSTTLGAGLVPDLSSRGGRPSRRLTDGAGGFLALGCRSGAWASRHNHLAPAPWFLKLTRNFDLWSPGPCRSSSESRAGTAWGGQSDFVKASGPASEDFHMTNRFPGPWRIAKLQNGFAVYDATGRHLGFFYGRTDPDVAGFDQAGGGLSKCRVGQAIRA
jgi:hypothetical protein